MYPKTQQLELLLDYLAPQARTMPEHDWQGWHLQRISGGMNKIVLRASRAEAEDGAGDAAGDGAGDGAGDEADIAIKFTWPDGRDRAGHEFSALCLLDRLHLKLAPRPLYFSDTRYAQPVVVQTWLAGEVRAGLPATPDEWHCLLAHLRAVHQVTPDMSGRVGITLSRANLSPASPLTLVHLAHALIADMPGDELTPELIQVMRHLDRAHLSGETESTALIRCDPNTPNFIRRSDGWRSVDWEYSGWGDPAFTIGEMLAHPKYLGLDEATWAWVIDAYCAGAKVGDTVTPARIAAYRTAMLAWWAAKCEQNMWLNAKHAGGRLVPLPADWRKQTLDLRARYIAAALSATRGVS